MDKLTTRRLNSLKLCLRIAKDVELMYNKQGKRYEVIWAELAGKYSLEPDTVRNKYYDWKQQPNEIQEYIASNSQQLNISYD